MKSWSTTNNNTLDYYYKIGYAANIDKYVLPNPVARTNRAFYLFN